jgi:hypothetical protein
MPPATRSAEREEERRLNTRTLTIASVASATAAAVTSQLWIAGTWVAAALTPVLVALISEAMHRPTERIARAWTTDRPSLGAGAARHADRPAPADEALSGAAGARAPRAGERGPVRVYRQPTARAPRRQLALGAVAATAAIAFVVAVVAVTAGDLISGGSIGKGGGRTTLFSHAGKKEQPQQQEQQDARPERTAPEATPTGPEEPPPTDTAPEQPPSDTAPLPAPPEAPAGEPPADPAPAP